MSNQLTQPNQSAGHRRWHRLRIEPLDGLAQEDPQRTFLKAPLSLPESTPLSGEETLITASSQFKLQDIKRFAEESHPDALATSQPEAPNSSQSTSARPVEGSNGNGHSNGNGRTPPSQIRRDFYEHTQTTPLPVPDQNEKTPTRRLPAARQEDAITTSDTVKLPARDGASVNAVHASALNGKVADAEVGERDTVPLAALKGDAKQQGKSQSGLKSEVSGAASDAGLVGFGNIIGSILKYVAAFLIQYGFGAGGYGLYTLSLSFINLISSILNLGLDDATVRYVSIYRSKQQMTSLRGILLFCTALAGIAGIIGAILLVVFTPPLVAFWIHLKLHHLANQDTLNRSISLLQLMAPVIPLMTMQIMWFAGLRGFKAFKWRVISTSILQPLLQIALLGLVLVFFHTRDGITAVALALLLSTFLNTFLGLYFLFKEMNKVATPEPGQYEVREWLTFASFNFLTTIIDTVLDSVDTILLAAFGVSDVQLGLYGAALRISNFVQMPLLSINNIFAPTIAELHSKGEIKKLESMFKIVTKWSVTFSLPLFLICVLFGEYLLILPGQSFAGAWPLLDAFALGAMINAGTGAVGYMLLMTGYQRLSFLNSAVAVVANIGLGILLTPRYGAMGTAISTGLAIVVLNIMRLLQVVLLLKMHPYRWDFIKPLGAGLISSALVVGIMLALPMLHLDRAAHIRHAVISVQLALIPVFLVSYVLLLVLFKGSPEDEIVLNSIRKKFLRGKKKAKKKHTLKEA